MLIEHYDLEVTTPPCEPGAERFNAIARFTVDISEVLPYLNATWKGAIYDHENHFLTWRGSGRTITVWPHEIAVSNLEDREEATQVVEQLVERINSTWERRTEIEPSTVKRQRLKALDIYKLLPGTNCKACGQPTCFIFASKLAVKEVDVEQCTPLFTDEYTEKREKLLALLEAAA
ncbi:MAG: Fe-S cluster protein [Thermoplasmata archaeon]|nr:MAG: Fe-S cluster protein [Chloroflexota bacterium]RLF30362.1 MAG: Fe-S cluster protein [Thermoplasmata archaeon]